MTLLNGKVMLEASELGDLRSFHGQLKRCPPFSAALGRWRANSPGEFGKRVWCAVHGRKSTDPAKTPPLIAFRLAA